MLIWIQNGGNGKRTNFKSKIIANFSTDIYNYAFVTGLDLVSTWKFPVEYLFKISVVENFQNPFIFNMATHSLHMISLNLISIESTKILFPHLCIDIFTPHLRRSCWGFVRHLGHHPDSKFPKCLMQRDFSHAFEPSRDSEEASRKPEIFCQGMSSGCGFRTSGSLGAVKVGNIIRTQF